MKMKTYVTIQGPHRPRQVAFAIAVMELDSAWLWLYEPYSMKRTDGQSRWLGLKEPLKEPSRE